MSNTNPPSHFLPANPTLGTTSVPFPLPPPTLFSTASDASSSSQPPPCSICNAPSKYTCPRCSRPTCSASCSKTHKTNFGCTGERDPAAYVDLKTYGQGTWGDDFRYLEESRRKILGWGEGLPKDSLLASSASSSRGGMGGRGGRGAARGGRGGMHMSNAERKVSGWKREMQRRGCWVETMPEGMSRRKENSSGWNQRSHILVLTFHISIPADLLSPDAPRPPNSVPAAPILFKHPRVLFSSPSAPSATIASLLPPAFSAELSSVVFLLPFHASPARPTPPLAGPRRPKLFFPPLDPNLPLDQVLRGTSWIEFPVIQIMKNHTWIILKAKGDLSVVEKADVGPYIPSHRAAGTPLQGKLVEEVGVKSANGETVDPAKGLGGLADYVSDDDFEEDQGEDEDMAEVDGAPDEQGQGQAGEEENVADVLGAIEIPGGPEMMQKVSEALLADFGAGEEDEEEVVMKEVETRRE